jgi:MoaA/NifB/PqqE/SkfB family radical SAM enzyme
MSRASNPTSATALLRSLPRAIDDLPIWAQLNITWKCNLDCAYCTEYDNSKDHVPFADLRARIDKIKELGALHTDLLGGEPMLHPDLARIMRHVVDRGMTTGMTTNGFLLTQARLDELIAAGMGRLQISVDTLRPTRATPKSLKTLRKKIELVVARGIWFRVNTVICEETVDEVEAVAEVCFELGVPINFSLVHDHGRLMRSASAPRFLEKIRWLREQKQTGKAIMTPYYLIEYYERALQGRPMDWTCQAGNKCFYVSPEGNFHFCYHVPPRRNLLEVTRAEMAGYRGKKGCEVGCGVDCVVHTSLPYSNLGEVAMIEVKRRAGGLLPILRD